MAGDLIDWFGYGISFQNEDGGKVPAYVTTNLQVMQFRALQYAPYVMVLALQKPVDVVKGKLAEAVGKYDFN